LRMVGATKLRRPGVGAIAGVAISLWAPLAYGDTLEGALVQAYQNNPSLNSQRASVRVTDENVPQALSGYRPKVNINGSIGTQYWDTTNRSQTLGIGGAVGGEDLDSDVAPESCVAGAVHFAHTSSAQRRDDLVGSETRTRGKRHAGSACRHSTPAGDPANSRTTASVGLGARGDRLA